MNKIEKTKVAVDVAVYYFTIIMDIFLSSVLYRQEYFRSSKNPIYEKYILGYITHCIFVFQIGIGVYFTFKSIKRMNL